MAKPNDTSFSISIHALRGEDDPRWIMRLQVRYNFYPRPPRGGRRLDSDIAQIIYKISIHALREEGDKVVYNTLLGQLWISIHALREEGDWCCGRSPGNMCNFYPRPPRGGRRPLS